MKQLLASGLLAASLLVSQASAEDFIRFAATQIDRLVALQRKMDPFKDAFEADESRSGKSTLLSCLAGHPRPNLGRIGYTGREVMAMTETDITACRAPTGPMSTRTPRPAADGRKRGRQRR